jgi:Trk-type K+ transport system membrane component
MFQIFLIPQNKGDNSHNKIPFFNKTSPCSTAGGIKWIRQYMAQMFKTYKKKGNPLLAFCRILHIIYNFAKWSIRYIDNIKNTDGVLHRFQFSQGFPPHHLLHSFWVLQLCTGSWYLLCLIKTSKALVKSWYFLNYLSLVYAANFKVAKSHSNQRHTYK